MIVFTDRQYNTIAFVDTKSSLLLDDDLNKNIDTGTAMFSAEFSKKMKDVEKIKVGNFVFLSNYGEKPIALEVMEVDEDKHTKQIVAQDAGLDLLNEDAEPIEFTGNLKEWFSKTVGVDSAWEIGLNEIGDDKKLTLEYTGTTTQTKRLAMVAGRFGAEVSYSFNMNGNQIMKREVNFHQKRGNDNGERLEVGSEVEGVRRRESIVDLCTAIKPIGEATEETIIVEAPSNLVIGGNFKYTKNSYVISEWLLSEDIKDGEEVTLTVRAGLEAGRSLSAYNSGSMHRLAELEKAGDNIYSKTFNWSIGNEGNTKLALYQIPKLDGSIYPEAKIDWVVLTKGDQKATKWITSEKDDMATPDIAPESSSNVKVNESNNSSSNAKIEKLIGWFTARIGKSGYSQSKRHGPYYYDCSSGVSYAARHAGFLPDSVGLPATPTLWTWGHQGKYFTQISKSQVRRGDIFVSRSALSANKGTGHTGVFLDDHKRIIHVSLSGKQQGAFESPATASWLGAGVRYFRWNELLAKPAPNMARVATVATPQAVVEDGAYWTNSQIIYHDIGKTLSGITADQLNNWIKAKSPRSPFNGKGNVFLEAQKQSGLDCRIILAHAAHESAWGTSGIAKDCHNYFGINAYDSNPRNACKSSNPSLEAGIIAGAKWIAKNYYNSEYKQTTLYKMRYNNGVHQYATDTAWHTKIANIAKGSEPFTRPSTIGSASSPSTTTKQVKLVGAEEVEYIEKTIQKETNLLGYEYDDGRYFVNKETGVLCDRESAKTWSRYKKDKQGYIIKIYESEAKSQKTLFDEAMRYLEQHNTPKIDYSIDISLLPDGIDIGDTLRVIDRDFKPPLYLEVRMVDVSRSHTNPLNNKALFSNIVEKESGIYDKLSALQDLVYSQKWEWENQPYKMEITSSNGNVFKDKIIDTELKVEITRAGINQTSSIDSFIWERITDDPSKAIRSDEDWNIEHEQSFTNILGIDKDDVDLEATFTCSAIHDGVVVATNAYTIKDLTIGIYKQELEPDRSLLSWGDIWQWEGDKVPDDGEALTIDEYQDKVSNNIIIPDITYYIFEKSLKKPFKRIWQGDRWVDTVTKRDLELIELTPGPPGADGKDGMPGEKGEDGRTPYVHFAYADSDDGSIGFTETATSGKKYIGMYTDFIEADSADPTKYEWSLFKGEDGQDGENGIPGKAGADGKTPYFHQAWANSADGVADFSTTISEDKIYIGTYVDFVQADSEDPSKYKWIKVKGESGQPGADGKDGMPGEKGEDGRTPYVHFAYADSDDGSIGFTKTATVGKKYIGMYVDFTESDSDDPSDYAWSLFKGEDGTNGIPGKAGADGKTPYFHTAYANSSDGNDDFSTEDSTNKIYIGTYVDYVELDSEDPTKYKWIKIKGEDGKSGQLGMNLLKNSNVLIEGSTSYLVNVYHLTDSIAVGETVTATLKGNIADGRVIRLFKTDGSTELGTLKKQENGLYTSTFKWKAGGVETQVVLYIGPNISPNPPVDIEWITLQRGDIPTLDWVQSDSDLNAIIDKKADSSQIGDLEGKYQGLVVHLEQIPPAGDLKKSLLDIEKQQAYLRAIEEAMNSDALDLESRLNIIEANVGTGAATINAVNSYFKFGEEGVLIGKNGEQVRVNIKNDALEILEGEKVVARFGNNQVNAPNLSVGGVFETGYHVFTKHKEGVREITLISGK